MFYKCEHFDVEELVDRATFEKWGEKAWMFLRAEALYSLDGIRRFFNRPTWVNNWAVGGKLEWRGLRPSYCNLGELHSQHRFGNAFDCNVDGISAEEVRKAILENRDADGFKYITCLETEITWVHFDCRNIPDRIRLVKP